MTTNAPPPESQFVDFCLTSEWSAEGLIGKDKHTTRPKLGNEVRKISDRKEEPGKEHITPWEKGEVWEITLQPRPGPSWLKRLRLMLARRVPLPRAKETS